MGSPPVLESNGPTAMHPGYRGTAGKCDRNQSPSTERQAVVGPLPAVELRATNRGNAAIAAIAPARVNRR